MLHFIVILKSINSLPPQNVHNGQNDYGFLFGESHSIKGCVIVGSNVMSWSKIQVLKKSHCSQLCKNTFRDTWKKKSLGNKFLFIGILIVLLELFNLITKKIAICIAHLVGLVTCPAEKKQGMIEIKFTFWRFYQSDRLIFVFHFFQFLQIGFYSQQETNFTLQV